MRISDWSSDVCSSDLAQDPLGKDQAPLPAHNRRERALPAWGYQHAGRPGVGGFAGEAAAGAWLRQVRPGGQRRAVSCQPLSCAAGEGGAKRRVRARLFEVSGQKKTRLAAGVLQVAGSPTRALGDDDLLAPTLRVGWRDKAKPALRRALDRKSTRLNSSQ